MTTSRPGVQPRTGLAVTAGKQPAPADPVARLMVDVPLPHLDRPFDYLVPEPLHEQVQPGSRVRVRFAGRLVDAYVLERIATTEHVGRLAYLERVVGAQPVLTAETAALFRAVADRYAGNFVDVLRLGVPARHARAENDPPVQHAPDPAQHASDPAQHACDPAQQGSPRGLPPGTSGAGQWERYQAGPAFLAAAAAGRAARAVWSALPGERWATCLAHAVRAVHDAGRGAVVVVPDARDLARLDAAMGAALGPGRHVALSAELGPAERYRRWLAARRGTVRVVIGTRGAAYAPVADLGLVAIWDDGDDLHHDPRAPYPHSRDVLVLRSAQTGAALLVGGWGCTAQAQLLVESGWAHRVAASRSVLRDVAPRILPVGEDAEVARDPAAASARLPSLAWRTAREALAAGNAVLVQVPRGGYVPSLACAYDRTSARCARCGGPLIAAGSGASPTCRWCATRAAGWTCPQCGEGRLRAMVVGSQRTAEELGRAFPGVPVRVSGGDHVIDEVPGEASLVVATPGAEPSCAPGYGAALLLDGWAMLSLPQLRATEETLRRWLNAAALVRAGASVVVGAPAGLSVVQALVRWDPAGHAARELAERAELRFPPAARMAALTGLPAAVQELLAATTLPPAAEVLGSLPAGPDVERVLVRAPREVGLELAAALKRAAAGRSLRRSSEPVKIDMDPTDDV